jgi:hypothetical protein
MSTAEAVKLKEVTADEIEGLLLRDRWRSHPTIPNYTPTGWFECDLIEFTDAGYFREYEIKVSRSDFFHDADKQSEVFPRAFGEPQRFENKHALLAARSPRGPAQFWFVVPKGLIRLNEVPEWAGLIEVCPGQQPYGRLHEMELKKAPRLHSTKPSDAIRQHALGVCYYRMHGALAKLTRLQRETRKQVKALRRLGWPQKLSA